MLLTKEPKDFCLHGFNRLESSNCSAGPLRNTMSEPPCKKQCNIATFFQPCLIKKISAETSNSSNEARGTSDVSDEIDRVLDGNTLAHDIPIPEDSHTSTSSNTGTSLSNLQGTISTTSYLVPGQPNQPTTIKFPKRLFGKFNREPFMELGSMTFRGCTMMSPMIKCFATRVCEQNLREN